LPALKQGIWSKATKVMTDQQNFEAVRPVSADPAVALAEALGQLPKTPVAKPQLAASVETLAKGLGLTIGDQNELTIRRIKRGKSYSFVRANGTPIRHTGTIKRLN
jgi:DNA topoisomerase-1